MYTLLTQPSMSSKGTFVTVLKDGYELEALSILYMSNEEELAQVQKLIDLANETLKKKGAK